MIYSASAPTTRAKIVDMIIIGPKGTARGAAAPRDFVGVAVERKDELEDVEYEEVLEVVDDTFVAFALSYIN